MNFPQIRSWFPIITLFSFSMLLEFPLFSADAEASYSSCAHTFSCGKINGPGYPFRGNDEPENCGYPGLVLNCQNNVTTIDIDNIKYRVLDIDQPTQTLKIVREDVIQSNCPQDLVSTTIEGTPFAFTSTNYINLTFLYDCPATTILLSSFFPVDFCNVSGYTSVYLFAGVQSPLRCAASVTIPVAGWDWSASMTVWNQALRGGFGLKWTVDSGACSKCTESKGRCGYNVITRESTCYCPDPPYVSDTCSKNNQGPSTPDPKPGSSSSNQAQTALFAVGGGVLALLLLGFAIFACRKRRKRIVVRSSNFSEAKVEDIPFAPLSKSLTTTTSTSYSQSTPSIPSSKYDSGKASTYFGVQVFTYTELEEATDNFNSSRELGDGGFGTVYYGKLEDGRAVAVKRLYENNFKRVEQFMNEVDILTRLRHNNLVTLYGCTSRRSRELLLVYEYIPNGTVADHLHGKRANSGLLSWPVRLSIAQETADALAYLHKSEVIHRDVKSNNILLDNVFRVKVADFGLSRLFPDNVTHVSTAPQGTPGYVDPEYYQLYHLTEKSDVYSFGVVLIELISSKQAVDTSRDRHDINLSNMAVNKIQNHELHELVDPSLGFETNSSVRRMITSVAELAFRCLQTERDMRPSMEEVLEALKSINNEDSNAAKVDVVDIVIVDDAAPLKKNSPPISPNSVVAGNWESISTTPNNSG